LVGFRVALLIHVPFGVRQCLFERLVKVLDGLPPIPLALLHFVQAFLHLGGEPDAEQVREELD
jgi:hypothetical protein